MQSQDLARQHLPVVFSEREGLRKGGTKEGGTEGGRGDEG